MKMKKEKNNGSAKRLIIILSLTLALLVALGAFSFAWIRNYVDVDSLDVTTGKMRYNFKMYRIENGAIVESSLFDTKNATDSNDAESEAEPKLERELKNSLVNIDNGEEIFFVIEKYDDSIDFDVAISFDYDGLPQTYEYIGQMNYAMYDATKEINGVNSQEALEAYIKAPGTNAANPVNLGNIWNNVTKASVEGNQKYACVRLKLAKNEGASADLEGKSFPLKVGFCVAQKGALPDDMKVDKFYVDDVTTLENAMQNYGFGDEIYITQDVNYTGDLVFTRPCSVTLIRSTLTLKGNLIFSYMYGGKFVLNTVSDGHIKIEKNKGAGGNFKIDLPDTTIEIAGANNDAAGKADIYVEGAFTANASKYDGEGLLFRGARICNATVNEAGKYTYSTDLKQILINGSTRVSVSNRTRLGELLANFYCRKLVLENNGYIQRIDASAMTQDLNLLSSPCILIDNAGTVADSLIVLPDWSKKFIDSAKANQSAEDNTHIIANKGSGELRAVTESNLNVDPAVVSAGDTFFSTGKKGDDGLRDDIDYLLRTQFVETIEGDKTKITIHYEIPSEIITREEQYADLATLNNLASFVNYYAASDEIAPVDQLTEVTVICYGEKVLTADDYNFIKTMTAVTALDLSEAVSANKAVPNNAFKGMSALKTVQMSESDTLWGQYLFTGTSVDEITFPQSLTKLDNPRDVFGKVNKQAVLDGIRYVHTSIDTVDGLYLSPNSTQYLFTPDQYAYDKYRALNSNVYWYSRIFLGEGVVRYGEYFLRYDPNTTEIEPTCEFVVFTGGVQFDSNGYESRIPWTEQEYNNCAFDFQRININGKVYKITSFDAYAFFDKLVREENLEIVIKSDVTYIGERAFACGPNMNATIGLESVTIEGNPEINGYAFAYNDTLASFNAPELTSLKNGYNLSNNNVLKTVYMPKLIVVEGSNDLHNSPKIERVDISVIEKTDINKSFYTSSDTSYYASFYIHTENANPVNTYSSALAADYRHIFVKESYAKLYKSTSTYTGVTDMGEKELDALIPADSDGNSLEDGEQLAYYYVLNGTDAHLVACMLPEISKIGEDYTTISSFDNGKYPVKYIGSAAYHFTSIIAQNIKITDGVQTLGIYAFDARKQAFKKYCITLDLNNVSKAGKGAFYYMDMVKVVGDELEEVGMDTFSFNQNLVLANIPNLSRSRPAGSTSSIPNVFIGCSNLRLAYVGFSKDIAYDDAISRTKSYIRFIKYSGDAEKITIPRINAVVNSSLPSVEANFSNNFVQVDKNFNGIYFSDYYEYPVSLKDLSDTIVLPGYVYHRQSNGELSLIAVSPDIELFGTFHVNANGGNDYFAPGHLYLEGDEYVSENNGTDHVFTVTSYGKHAYGAVNMVGVQTFTVADSVKKLENAALRGSAYKDSGVAKVTLDGVDCLDLANVVEIGAYTCYDANIKSLKALKLETIGDMAFTYCRFLDKVYLPSFVSSLGTYTFRYCYSLKEATFGPNTKSFANNIFDGDEALKKITILNMESVITIGASVVPTKYSENVIVSVPAAIYSAYTTQYKNGFGGIPAKNIQKFGASTTLNGLTYYWNVLDEASKTAYIDYVEGTLPSTVTFPATLDGYTIVAISPVAMSKLTDVTKVVLPAEMKYISFNTADLSESITTLEIASTNTSFETANGILYSKGKTILYVYPRAKAATSFTLDSTVKEIAYRAFYGTKNLKTLYIGSAVTVRDQAFEASGISAIDFTSSTPSTFVGRDIFLNANVNLKLKVPASAMNAYKANVLIDYSILEKFVNR